MARTQHSNSLARRAGAVLGATVTAAALLTVAAPAASAADPMDGYACEGGGYRIYTPSKYGSENLVLDVSKSRPDHGSIVQYRWNGAANQQFQVCSRPDPNDPNAKFYKFKDHMRWWCLAIDRGYGDDGRWLITEECNWDAREVFWGKTVPGTGLTAFQAQNSGSWLVAQGGGEGDHVVQMQFQADLFRLDKVW
ncbi:RICIN domain-containing protein [Kitasatospora sp. NPDC015120]|uniref:RICIN domain-containing protein n=1 Tax=Kitasatospora sp. NPDC015120 TaxID=3364023 RepID=UPI0036F465D2